MKFYVVVFYRIYIRDLSRTREYSVYRLSMFIILGLMACTETERIVEDNDVTCHSPYTWGEDEVLFVCPTPLPLTETSGYGPIPVGSFALLNYRDLLIHVDKLCFKNVGDASLTNVHQIDVDVQNGALMPLHLSGPWPDDGRICVDLPITIGAQSVGVINAFYWLEDRPGTRSAEYQLEISSSEDITLNEDQEIDGEFPVQSDPVQVVGQQ